MTVVQPLKTNHSVDDIAHGRNVLIQEIKGLQALADTLDEHFARAVECIASIKGRVIVSGMGKSGHVARKIAATFASTGTPAHFVHPGEASHGDLGMITRDDAVLALSNSGETKELADIVAYCKRFSIPLIAMVRRQSSMLVEAADIAIVLPAIPEAPPTDAPTTSTTMMMALGDAIAVATSGTAERGAHIIDPHTGSRPSVLASVSIAGRELSTVDAYATAAFAMGELAADWVDSLAEYQGLLIYRDGTRWSSPGLRPNQ